MGLPLKLKIDPIPGAREAFPILDPFQTPGNGPRPRTDCRVSRISRPFNARAGILTGGDTSPGAKRA